MRLINLVFGLPPHRRQNALGCLVFAPLLAAMALSFAPTLLDVDLRFAWLVAGVASTTAFVLLVRSEP